MPSRSVRKILAPAASRSSSGGSDLASSPIAKIFAAPSSVTLGLQFSQNIFTAGKLTALNKGADAMERAAIAGVSTARAQLVIDVAQAYYNAVAADRMSAIADSALAQADRALNQTTLARQVGTSSEFDLLRARVTRDNARPQAIQARSNSAIAYMHLRQMLGLSLSGPMTLTTLVRDDLTAEQAMAQTATTVLTAPVALPRAEKDPAAAPEAAAGFADARSVISCRIVMMVCCARASSSVACCTWYSMVRKSESLRSSAMRSRAFSSASARFCSASCVGDTVLPAGAMFSAASGAASIRIAANPIIIRIYSSPKITR